MQNFGLVLAGGGGNGAFEMGVWKAIKEIGEYNITAVSGSSVGALNAAFFAAGRYDEALYLWQNITDKDIKIPLKESEKSAHSNIRGGIWSSAGVERIIRTSGILDGFDIPCAVCCTIAPEKKSDMAKSLVTYTDKVRYFTLNNEPSARIVKILLASTAIVHGFPEQKIDGRFYRDGDNVGRGDCMPVKPLYDMGLRDFIVVHLDNHKKLRISNEKELNIIHIYPPHELDNPLTILDFSHESNSKRLERGYMAAVEALF